MGRNSRLLLRNIGVLVTCDPARGQDGPLGLVRRAAVLCEGDRIVYAGPESGLPDSPGEEPLTLDLDGSVVTPGLIDCHTHLVFAGDRLDDYEARLAGDSYSAIAARGGGILSTVQATRAASDELLEDLCAHRVETSLAHGVTTIEVKTGYGLDVRQELRLLEVINRCRATVVPDLVPTLLAAHSLPIEARRSEAARRAHVDSIVYEMIPEAADRRLARFADVYVEDGVYTVEEGRRILAAAAAHGLGLKIHAEQFSRQGGARLAAELGAVSAEHLEHAQDEDLRALADAGTVAVLLPGAAFFLRDEFPDAARFRAAGVAMAVSTDWNPGTSPTGNLLLMAQMAVLGCGMTLDEALLGITLHAARALSLDRDRGRLTPGFRADLSVFSCLDPRELLYAFGSARCSGVVKDGRWYRAGQARPGGRLAP